MEIHAVINREFNLMLAVRQQQTTVGVHVLDKARYCININGIRQITRQPHDNGNIGMVAFTGQGKGTIYITTTNTLLIWPLYLRIAGTF